MKQIISTDKAPAPIGPYNQATAAGNILFVSGQIALDANTGELENESIEKETQKAMENLKAVIEAANSTMDHVVKCSIFISDMNQFSAINAVYSTFFNHATAPARETVEVARLPQDVNVEISAIAIIP